MLYELLFGKEKDLFEFGGSAAHFQLIIYTCFQSKALYF